MQHPNRAIVGGTKANRAVLTVCNHAEYQQALNSITSERMRAKGLHRHLNVVANPSNPRQLFIGPSAVAGINDGHSNVVSEVVYALIAASGNPSNQTFERGSADLIAQELKARLGLDIFTENYPAEREFTLSFIEAIKDTDEEVSDVLGLLRRSPRQFFQKTRGSIFYRWLATQMKKDDSLSPYLNLLGTMSTPGGQIDGNFRPWVKQCADLFVNYRRQQSEKAQARWAKQRAEEAAAQTQPEEGA